MAYKVKTNSPCESCGTMTNRRVNKRRTPLCLECATNNVVRAATEIHHRNGAAYDSWIVGMQKAMDRVTPTRAPSANEMDEIRG